MDWAYAVAAVIAAMLARRTALRRRVRHEIEGPEDRSKTIVAVEARKGCLTSQRLGCIGYKYSCRIDLDGRVGAPTRRTYYGIRQE